MKYHSIGLFCGCFNPVHNGHIRAAEAFRSAAGLDCVFLVPASDQYRKPGVPAAAGAHRLRMCALAAGGHAGIAVCGFEVRAPELPYTIDTVEYARAQFPGAEISLCMGGDAAKALPRWACFEPLRKNAAFLVINRAGDSGRPEQLLQSGARVTLIHQEPDGISSAAVRKKLQAGDSSIPELDGRVLRYIRENALYHQ